MTANELGRFSGYFLKNLRTHVRAGTWRRRGLRRGLRKTLCDCAAAAKWKVMVYEKMSPEQKERYWLLLCGSLAAFALPFLTRAMRGQ